MSITGKLIIDGQSFNLLSYRIRFFQQRDIAGQPRGRVQGGIIEVRIEAHRDHMFHHWALQPDQMRDLELHFAPVTKISASRVIQLYDVYCAKVAVDFDNYTKNPMTYSLVLSPGIYVDGGVVFKKPWHVTDLEAEDAEPTPAPEQEPKVLSMFFTDMNNSKIEDTPVNTEVYLHIRSRNMEGEKIAIELHDPKVDFLYEGKRLVNDTLQDYIITNADERILLEVVPQEEEVYDEQLKATDAEGTPIADLWYCIILDDTIVLSGQTNAEGLTERIPAESETKEYQCLWGDEALSKIE